MFTPSFSPAPVVNTLYCLEEFHPLGITSPPRRQNSPMGDNFAPGGESLPLGAKLRMSPVFNIDPRPTWEDKRECKSKNGKTLSRSFAYCCCCCCCCCCWSWWWLESVGRRRRSFLQKMELLQSFKTWSWFLSVIKSNFLLPWVETCLNYLVKIHVRMIQCI
jgi:hypothetical protein